MRVVLRGDGVACGADTCPDMCACDWNGDGTLDTEDISAFLEDFRMGDADFNHDGTTDREDLVAFLECYIHGCR